MSCYLKCCEQCVDVRIVLIHFLFTCSAVRLFSLWIKNKINCSFNEYKSDEKCMNFNEADVMPFL